MDNFSPPSLLNLQNLFLNSDRIMSGPGPCAWSLGRNYLGTMRPPWNMSHWRPLDFHRRPPDFHRKPQDFRWRASGLLMETPKIFIGDP